MVTMTATIRTHRSRVRKDGRLRLRTISFAWRVVNDVRAYAHPCVCLFFFVPVRTSRCGLRIGSLFYCSHQRCGFGPRNMEYHTYLTLMPYFLPFLQFFPQPAATMYAVLTAVAMIGWNAVVTEVRLSQFARGGGVAMDEFSKTFLLLYHASCLENQKNLRSRLKILHCGSPPTIVRTVLIGEREAPSRIALAK